MVAVVTRPRRGRWWTFKGRTYWWDQRGGRWVLLRFTPMQQVVNAELADLGGPRALP